MHTRICYRDDYIVAINKPSGLLVHRTAIDRHETRFAVQLLREYLGQKVYPVHRLDKPTSGVLLFALSPEITSMVAHDWEHVEKYYLAIVRGRVTATEVNHPVKTITERGNERTQDAHTLLTTCATAELPVVFGKNQQFTHTTFSLVQARLLTGRQHQIRKHLKHIHHPLVGDTRYGRGEINRYFRAEYGINRLMLHCQALCLNHPITKKRMTIHASLDTTWRRVMATMQWRMV